MQFIRYYKNKSLANGMLLNPIFASASRMFIGVKGIIISYSHFINICFQSMNSFNISLNHIWGSQFIF